jgi:hypothetical protein
LTPKRGRAWTKNGSRPQKRLHTNPKRVTNQYRKNGKRENRNAGSTRRVRKTLAKGGVHDVESTRFLAPPSATQLTTTRVAAIFLCILTESQAHCRFPGARINERLHATWNDPARRKRINSMSQFLDHLANDAMPALMDRLSAQVKP